MRDWHLDKLFQEAQLHQKESILHVRYYYINEKKQSEDTNIF